MDPSTMPAEPTPEEFEQLVRGLLEASGAELSQFSAAHREVVPGVDGEYEIDVTARFRALGADFFVLVECKRHSGSIKREVVQILADKLRSTGAQKGMLFTTSRFQVGAIEYAARHGIALVRLVAGMPEWVTRRDSTDTGRVAVAGSWQLWIIREPSRTDPSRPVIVPSTVESIRNFLFGELPPPQKESPHAQP